MPILPQANCVATRAAFAPPATLLMGLTSGGVDSCAGCADGSLDRIDRSSLAPSLVRSFIIEYQIIERYSDSKTGGEFCKERRYGVLVQFGLFHSHRGFSPVIGRPSATQQ